MSVTLDISTFFQTFFLSTKRNGGRVLGSMCRQETVISLFFLQVAVSKNMSCFSMRDKLECYALDNDYAANGGGLWTTIPGLAPAP